MFNFSIKESLIQLKNKKYNPSITKTVDELVLLEEYQLYLIVSSRGIKLTNLIVLNFSENIGFRCTNLQPELYGYLPLCKNVEKFLNEKYQSSFTSSDNIVEFIKSELSEGGTWKNFVDNQELGQCQSIVRKIENISIIHNLPVEVHFGDVTLDDYHNDTNTEEDINTFAHHWVTINDKIYEFSKGTLKDYIAFDNLYEVSSESNKSYDMIR